jgi:uncharacterized membrane protein YphA (DoxX/SURF4 family)
MNTTLWILQGVLAAFFAGAGTLKLVTRTIAGLEAKLGGWVHDVPLPLIRTVGALEIAAALGLTLSPAIDVAPYLVWLAAAGLIVMMIGAGVIHARRRETKEVVVNVVLVLLAGIVTAGRSGPYSF